MCVCDFNFVIYHLRLSFVLEIKHWKGKDNAKIWQILVILFVIINLADFQDLRFKFKNKHTYFKTPKLHVGYFLRYWAFWLYWFLVPLATLFCKITPIFLILTSTIYKMIDIFSIFDIISDCHNFLVRKDVQILNMNSELF